MSPLAGGGPVGSGGFLSPLSDFTSRSGSSSRLSSSLSSSYDPGESPVAGSLFSVLGLGGGLGGAGARGSGGRLSRRGLRDLTRTPEAFGVTPGGVCPASASKPRSRFEKALHSRAALRMASSATLRTPGCSQGLFRSPWQSSKLEQPRHHESPGSAVPSLHLLQRSEGILKPSLNLMAIIIQSSYNLFILNVEPTVIKPWLVPPSSHDHLGTAQRCLQLRQLLRG